MYTVHCTTHIVRTFNAHGLLGIKSVSFLCINLLKHIGFGYGWSSRGKNKQIRRKNQSNERMTRREANKTCRWLSRAFGYECSWAVREWVMQWITFNDGLLLSSPSTSSFFSEPVVVVIRNARHDIHCHTGVQTEKTHSACNLARIYFTNRSVADQMPLNQNLCWTAKGKTAYHLQIEFDWNFNNVELARLQFLRHVYARTTFDIYRRIFDRPQLRWLIT